MAIEGRKMQRPGQGNETRLPKRDAKPSPPFRWFTLPEAWNWLPETGEWLPALRKMAWVAGVNGGANNKRMPGGFDPTGPAQVIRSKAGTIIEPFDSRLEAEGYDGYVRDLDNTSGNKVHFGMFEEWNIVGTRGYRRHNDDEFHDFQRFLLTSKIVAPMHEEVRRGKLEQQQSRIDRLVARVGAEPSNGAVRSKLDTFQATLYGMEHGCSITEAHDILNGVKRPAVDVDAEPETPTKRGPGRPRKQASK